jgi:hypothetical protein
MSYEPGCKPTHQPLPTLDRRDTTERVKKLWEEIRDTISNEEAWQILSKALHSYQPSRYKTCYVAGPMRGHEEFNFPAFFSAEEQLWNAGWVVWNPARIDMEEDGFNPKTATSATGDFPMEHYVRRDVGMICSLRPGSADAVVCLRGWSKSTGAKAEVRVARWLGVKVLSLSEACSD